MQQLFALAARSVVPVGRALGLGAAGGAAFTGASRLVGGDGDVDPLTGLVKPRRRRRRRVLTANDRSDIAFIVATLGGPAGKAFAMIVAART